MKGTTTVVAVLLLGLWITVCSCQINKWQQLTSMPTPTIEYAVSMATGVSEGDTNNIYIFGRPWNAWRNYMYKYDTGAGTWNALSQDATVGTGVKPRWFQSGTFLNNGRFWIFAGVEDGGTSNGIPSANFINTLIQYDFGTNKVQTAGPGSPSGSLRRQSPSLNQVSDTQLVMFGGCEGNPNKNDTWIYNLNSNSWNLRNPQYIIPPARDNATIPTYMSGRCGHSAVWIESTKEVLMFGGHSGGGFLGDLWAYNPTNNTWTFIQPEGTAAPTSRCYHSASVIGDDLMLIFGGDTESIDHSDELWAYSRSFNRWVLLSGQDTTKPTKRSHHSHVTVGQNKLYVYGGMGHADNGNNIFLSDLWTYELGCANSCSGHGSCDKFICVCNDCWGGNDCNTNICEPEKIEKPAETKTIVLGTILAIVFSVLFVVIVAVVVTSVILYKFKQFKKMKEATELATVKKGDSVFGEKE